MKDHPRLAKGLLALCLLLQSINLAAGGVGVSYFTNLDKQSLTGAGHASNLQKNVGYLSFVLTGSILSVFLYSWLLWVKCRDEKRSHRWDLVGLILAVVFQMALGVTLAIAATNSEIDYKHDQEQLAILEAMGVSGETVKNYSRSEDI